MRFVECPLQMHSRTKRDYRQRVLEFDKAECAEVAVRFGKEYWDGPRQCGYGGYVYDGRWRPVAETLARRYEIQPGASILDVGCGKGHLLYEFTQVTANVQVTGIDISEYAISHAKEEVKACLRVGSAVGLPFPSNSFDFVISINTLHNLYNYDLHRAIQEIERVGNQSKLIIVEAYRTEREKVNLLYWQLTCRAFHTPKEWEWTFRQAGYTGDYSYIVFD